MLTHQQQIKEKLWYSESADAYFIFEKQLREFLKAYLDFEPPMHLLDADDLILMYRLLYHVKSPRRAKGNMVTKKELRQINKLYQRMIRKEDMDFDFMFLSVLEYNIFAVFQFVIADGIKSEERKAILKEEFSVGGKLEYEKMITTAYRFYLSSFIKIVAQMSDVRKKYYSFEMIRCQDTVGTEVNCYVPIVSACYAVQKKLNIHNKLRPVFKLGVSKASGQMEWVKVPKALLGDSYQGKEDDLEMFIQSHALNRMKERLDVFDQMTLNLILWQNTIDIKAFEHYKNYLLLPLKVLDIKIGYLICNIFDDELVVRSFLFITHSCTPEGDKLKEITGLKRSDISYWKIDRLSTLLQIDHEHQPQLLHLFEQAGIQDIMSLKDQDLDIDALQNANMDAFLDYLKQSEVDLPELSKLPESVIKEEIETVESLGEPRTKKRVFVSLIALFVIPYTYFRRKLKSIFNQLLKIKK